MDLRTKLVFALVLVSLASMLVLGALADSLAGNLLTAKTLRHLQSLAETKKENLDKVVLAWQDRVSLIASRTQLRQSLRAYNETRGREEQRVIRQILSDAQRSSRILQSLAVYDVDGSPVTRVARGPDSDLADLDPSELTATGEAVSFQKIFFTAEDEPQASFVAPLILEERRIGTLHAVLSAQELIDVTRNYTGLGETGETMIVVWDSAGVARVLGPVRHRATERPGPVRPREPDDPATWAIQGNELVASEGLIDYRGEPVWAATRFLPGVGWGVVVKFDAEEERESIESFRRELAQLGLALSAFAILLGTIVGLRFAKPIHDLAKVANRIRLGELDARARVAREDELGLLARTFNQMAEELERQMTLLHEFKKIFDLSLDMLCIAGTDSYFKRVNPAFERTLGWTAKELLSRPFIDFVHPDDVESTVREVEKLSQGIPTVSFENRYRCADGTYKQLLWTSFPEPDTGLLYAIARDITEFKQAQERLRSDGEPESNDSA